MRAQKIYWEGRPPKEEQRKQNWAGRAVKRPQTWPSWLAPWGAASQRWRARGVSHWGETARPLHHHLVQSLAGGSAQEECDLDLRSWGRAWRSRLLEDTVGQRVISWSGLWATHVCLPWEGTNGTLWQRSPEKSWWLVRYTGERLQVTLMARTALPSIDTVWLGYNLFPPYPQLPNHFLHKLSWLAPSMLSD